MMKAWKTLPILSMFLFLGILPLGLCDDDTPPWEEEEDVEFQSAKSNPDIPPWEEEEDEEAENEGQEKTVDSGDESLKSEKVEAPKPKEVVDDSFPELNYENMNIQAANQKEVESKKGLSNRQQENKKSSPSTVATKVTNRSHKVEVSYYGKQEKQDKVVEKKENHRIDESQLISGSAPLYQ